MASDPALCIDCERSTGGACPRHTPFFPPINVFSQAHLDWTAEHARIGEREACAKICDEIALVPPRRSNAAEIGIWSFVLRDLAALIRARAKKDAVAEPPSDELRGGDWLAYWTARLAIAKRAEGEGKTDGQAPAPVVADRATEVRPHGSSQPAAGPDPIAEHIEPSPACPSCADLRSRLSIALAYERRSRLAGGTAMLARREAFEEAAQIADEEAMRSVKPNGRAARKSRAIAKMIRLRAEEGAK